LPISERWRERVDFVEEEHRRADCPACSNSCRFFLAIPSHMSSIVDADAMKRPALRCVPGQVRLRNRAAVHQDATADELPYPCTIGMRQRGMIFI